MTAGAYPTAELALDALTDDALFEKVCSILLRDDFPGLVPLGGSGDEGRDAVLRRGVFGEEEIVFQYSLTGQWSTKVRRELKRYETDESLPHSMIFCSSRSTQGATIRRLQAEAEAIGVKLEVRGRAWLLMLLDGPRREVAERLLHVSPRQPSRFLTPRQFAARLDKVVPGFGAPLVGAETLVHALSAFVASDTGPRVLFLVGPGGVGKSRLALECAQLTESAVAVNAAQRLDREAVSEIPIGPQPCTVLVDDAHRIEDLSGLRLMLDDPRWSGVRVVCTLRPGFEPQVQASAGLSEHEVERFEVGPLGRLEIDQLLRQHPHPINSEGLRTAIIRLAQGIPLIAHLAAAGVHRGDLVADGDGPLLRRYLASSISGLTDPAARHLVAIVAAFGTFDADARAGVLRAVFPNRATAELRGLLNSLADCGLLMGSGPTFSVKPDRLAPVVLADAFFPKGGIPALVYASDVRPHVAANERRVVAGILAEAVEYAEGRGAGELHALLGEWPAAAERSALRWSEALQDARQVVQAIPAQVGRLMDNFVAGWPHEPGPPDDLFRATPEDALARAGEVAAALAAIDPVAGCDCLLSLATLGSEDPLGPGRSLGPERDLETLLTHGWPEWSGTMTRRGHQLLGAIAGWLALREDSSEARRVAAFAAGHLVAVSFEFSREASTSAREIRFGAFMAPNTVAHRDLVLEAATLVARLAPTLDARGHRQLLQRFAEISALSRGAEAGFGLAPAAWARALMGEAADVIRESLLGCWHRMTLPNRARFQAIGGNDPRVADYARRDLELEHFQGMFDDRPVSEGEFDLDTWRAAIAARARRVVDALSPLGAVEAFCRFTAEVRDDSGPIGGQSVIAFLDEVAQAASTAECRDVIGLLLASPATAPHAPTFLQFALSAHGECLASEVERLIAQKETVAEVARLLDALPADQEEHFVARLLALGEPGVASSVASHLGWCSRLPPLRRASLLLDCAESAQAHELPRVLSMFSEVEVPPPLQDRFLESMQRMMELSPLRGFSSSMRGAFKRVAFIGADHLMDLVEARMRSMLTNVNGIDQRDLATDDVRAAMRELDHEARDQIVDRIAGWFPEVEASPVSYRVRSDLKELLRSMGLGGDSLPRVLMTWAGGGENERSRAVDLLHGLFGTDLFDPVARAILTASASDDPTRGLLWAADVAGVRVGHQSATYRERADYFRQWVGDSTPAVAQFGVTAVAHFSRLAKEEAATEHASHAGY